MGRYKTLRQKRYDILRKSGFADWEAIPLSKVPKTTPYLKHMINDRREAIEDARQKGRSERQFMGNVKNKYRANQWTRKDPITGVIDVTKKEAVWKMFRAYEDEYKQKNKQYNSPWKRRQQRWDNFRQNYTESKGYPHKPVKGYPSWKQ